jgi:ABC-2 type transport system permease protein
MLVRTANLIAKELIQFRRDRLLTLFILLAPVLQLSLMARNVERGITEQPAVVVDLDRSSQSRQLLTDLDNTDGLQVRFYVDSLAEMGELLDGGQARLAVVIPAGFEQALNRPTGDPPQLQIIADGTNSMVASVTMSSAATAVTRFSAYLAAGYGLGDSAAIDFRTDVRFNPSLDVRDYTIPAQLGFIIYQITLAVAALGLARERELGTLEQLMVTPLRSVELVAGKGSPAVAIGMLNFGAMYAVSLAVFKVPMHGSLLLLSVLTLLFVVAVVGWGLVLSAVSRTQQQAILLVFIQAMIEVAFSGFLVPVKNMPALLQAISRFVPLQYYLSIVRSIMLKGAGLAALWPQALALLGLSLLIVVLAFRMVARRVE